MRLLPIVLLFFITAVSINAQDNITEKILSDIYIKAGLDAKSKPVSFLKQFAASKEVSGDVYIPQVILAYAETDSGLTITKDSVLYNPQGLPLAAVTQINAGNGWINLYKDSSAYLGNRPVFTERSLWKNGSWSSVMKRIMEYNNEGSLLRLAGEVVNSQGTMKYEIHYTYNEIGKMKEAIHYVVDNSGLTPEMRYSFKYSSTGETAEFLMEYNNEGMWSNYSLESHEFDNNGMEVLRLYSMWQGGAWLLYERRATIRNMAGLVTCEVNQYRASGVLSNTDSASYTYDDKGRAVLEMTAYWNNGNWILLDSISYSYDDLDRLARQEWHMLSENQWLKWNRRTYEYNVNGKLAAAIMDEGTEANAWETSEKLEYNYDDKRNRVKGEYFKRNNDMWAIANGGLEIDDNYYIAYLAEANYIKVQDPIGIGGDKINPEYFTLDQNYPNPFNPETKISFTLPQSGKTALIIYDMLGRQVAELVNGIMEKGAYKISFNGRDLASGIYIYRLQSGRYVESKKMILMK